jgi:hypothetical protein
MWYPANDQKGGDSLANPYTKQLGYKYCSEGLPNGAFCVFDRGLLGEKWYLEEPQHQWLLKKMPDGPSLKVRTFELHPVLLTPA